MRLRACMLAIAVLTPLRAFAQTPEAAPPAVPPPPPPAPPATAPMVPAATVAAPAPSTAPTPAPAPAPDTSSPIVFDGLLDTYYMYNFTGANSLTSPLGAPLAVRAYDLNSNAFTLAYAKLGVGIKASEAFSFRLDTGYGGTGAITNSFAEFSGAPNPPAVTPPASPYAATGFFVEQAYAEGNFGPVTVDFGKFDTWAGAEVIQNQLNWQYSRSILFSYIPALHTGVRGQYKINDMFTVKLAVVNAWNDLGFEGSLVPGKTFGASIAITLPGGLAITPTGYFGKVVPGGNIRSTADLVALYQKDMGGFKNGLQAYFNFDYIKETGNAVYGNGYWGVAAAARYQLHDHFALGLRGEFAQFLQPSGTDAVNLYEGTLTGAIPMNGHYELRVEFRGDGASQADFNGGADKSQVTGTLGVIAWF